MWCVDKIDDNLILYVCVDFVLLFVVQGEQLCKDCCQYVYDIGMFEYYCGNGCMYEKYV